MGKYKIMVVLLALIFILVGCNTGKETTSSIAPDSTSSSVAPSEAPKAEAVEAPVIPQAYALEDFLSDSSDVLLFTPRSKDYIMTERYWQGTETYMAEEAIGDKVKLVEKAIVFHKTTIYEFDENGMLTAQREKYIFPTEWRIPNDVYLQDMSQREDYINAKLVEQLIYADVAPANLDTAKTKAERVAMYIENDRKFYMSVPIATSTVGGSAETPVAQFCSNCGAKVSGKFCAVCGTPL